MSNTDSEKVDSYVEYLRAIRRTRLIYNEDITFGKHIDWFSDLAGMSAFRLRSTMFGLSYEAKTQTQNEVELEDLLDEYKRISDYYVSSLKRSYSFDLHKFDATRDQGKKEKVFALLDYMYAYEDEKKQQLEKILSGKKMSCIIADADTIKGNEDDYAIPILLLLLIGILPTYDSTLGDVKDIFNDYKILTDFLKEFAVQSASRQYFYDTPYLTRYDTEMNIERQRILEKIKYGDESVTESIVLNRLRFIQLTKGFFDLLSKYANNTAIGDNYKNLEFVFPDLDGIWSDSEHENTDFWKFEQITNGYFFYHFHLVSSSTPDVEPYLTVARYEGYIISENGENVLYLVHPNTMYNLVKEKRLTESKLWSYIDMDSDQTKLWKEKKPTTITKLSLTHLINSANWFTVSNFYRIKDVAYYNHLLEKYEVVNEFRKEEYKLDLCLVAMTRDYLYFALDESDLKNLHASHLTDNNSLLKVPRSISDAYQNVTFNDAIGIVTFEDKTVYVGSSEHLLYQEITTEELRNELGVSLTDDVVE